MAFWAGYKNADTRQNSPVAAAEHREAAFGGEAVVNPATSIYLKHRSDWFDDGFAAERSLAGSAAATGFSQIEKYPHFGGYFLCVETYLAVNTE
ncbi:hypothetical protein [Pseudomonas sp. B21-053]|uniref:hypothetical protein n=1 Tax=Pseudomonas sp. B21-053 TaxID=2895493 RepID=UPI00222F290F|nr:hypothetical protein [Pseudomonas sp. B21-053]UZE09782.1 hypothetical protein LOY68_19935 [Pseudomonas sp. B21-053]